MPLHAGATLRAGAARTYVEGVVLPRGHALAAQVGRKQARAQPLPEGHQAVLRARRQLLRRPCKHFIGMAELRPRLQGGSLRMLLHCCCAQQEQTTRTAVWGEGVLPLHGEAWTRGTC